MKRLPPASIVALSTISLLLSACAVGPDYVRPELAAAPHWYANLPHDGSTGAVTRWWAQFDDPLLAELVDEAQRDNPDLNQSLARLAQSRAGTASARASLLPSVSASALWQRNNGELGNTQIQNLSQPSLDAGWEIDLFGANRRSRDAAQARYEGAQADWHDARVSLAAEVAQEYVGLRACQALVKDSTEDLASRRESERLTRLKVDSGFDSPADGALTVASSADATVRLNSQQAECDIGVKALVALTGLPEPDLRARLTERTGTLPTPATFSVEQLPAQTLEQRPDIAAAERELAAASAEIGVAEAARYPSLTLTGSIGLPTLRSGGTTLDGKLWSFGPALKLPIFDGGRLAADADAARARYDEALAKFNGRVRKAVREVEQALVRLDSASARESDARRAADNYDKVFLAANDRWRVGAGSLLDLEDTRRIALASRTQLLTVQRERISAWISLYRALGGGWSSTALTAEALADTRH